MPIKHAKTSAVADAADTGLVRPTDWNADHTGENYATVQDEGVDLTQRAKLNFTGPRVTATDDAAGLRTKVDIPNPMTTQGDTIHGGASGAETRLAIGAPGAGLKVNAGGTAPEWSASAMADEDLVKKWALIA